MIMVMKMMHSNSQRKPCCIETSGEVKIKILDEELTRDIPTMFKNNDSVPTIKTKGHSSDKASNQD